jgi:hypothetical protein
MIPWSWPRPGYALHEAPEIACVDALGITLQITVAVMRAANPTTDGGRPRGHDARAWMAQSVMSHAEALRVALERYRDAVKYELLSRDDHANDDPLF